ncbi:hypothetical protein ACFVS2_25015 [Brevibacillus sp. NPDC058079]|uniref:hypothetical protein n=1 Tax=Brevibacillus sp. NPDC058079 TaxID=3346330 RepID=UPI0036E99DA1
MKRVVLTILAVWSGLLLVTGCSPSDTEKQTQKVENPTQQSEQTSASENHNQAAMQQQADLQKIRLFSVILLLLESL